MKKSVKKPTYFIIPAILIVLLILAIYLEVRGVRLSPIPRDTVGNTAGNIRGEGRFCEYKGKVYFSNPYDNGALYVMNSDCTDMKRLLNSSVSYINAGGNYLFYYLEGKNGGTGLGHVRSTTGIYRSTLKGKESSCLDSDMATMMILVGDQIYFQHYDNTDFSTFHKVPAAGSDKETELSRDIVETACALNGTIYYSGILEDHFLHAWDTETDTTKVILEGNISYPTVIENYVYFMNVDADYRLFRYNTSNDELTALTDERIDFYNIYDNVIFYQTNSADSPALMRMTLAGGSKEVVAYGVYHRINTTSTYTYFQPYKDDETIYRTSTFGPVAVDNFPEAEAAALNYRKD
ncbi:MAG: DUF5050 domain-containing protein [Lachnospiraceae bacterium]|nr:DUF5050 domain-containing protein [Lachnospiraceae bacterium]